MTYLKVHTLLAMQPRAPIFVRFADRVDDIVPAAFLAITQVGPSWFVLIEDADERQHMIDIERVFTNALAAINYSPALVLARPKSQDSDRVIRFTIKPKPRL